MLFAFQDGEAKYRQLYRHYRQFIETNQFKAGDQLPSIRQLARDLAVSRNTVLVAYEQLMAEGYIRSEKTSGYFVNELDFYTERKETPPSFERVPTATNDETISFLATAVDEASFPKAIWRKVTNDVLHEADSYHYGERCGEMVLRQQLSAYLWTSRGVYAPPERIFIASSTQQLFMQLGFLLRDDYDELIVENPSYDGGRDVFRLHRFTIEAIAARQFNELAERQGRLFYVTPSNQSPLGHHLSIAERKQLISWAKRVDGLLIEDDYDSEFRYNSQPLPALTSLDGERVIYLGNFSKSFLPGIRLSYVVLPEYWAVRYREQFAQFECSASLLHQRAMAKLMAKLMATGEWQRHIKRMRLVYKKKMAHAVAEITRLFGTNVTLLGAHTGLYLVIRVHGSHSEATLLQRAEEAGVRLQSLARYFVDAQERDPLFKLGISHLSLEQITLGLEQLAHEWYS